MASTYIDLSSPPESDTIQITQTEAASIRDYNIQYTLECILKELEKLNFQISIITDEEVL